MPRKKKPSGRLHKGPFAFSDLLKAITADGWFKVEGTLHEAYRHPTKKGKVNLSKKWDGVKYPDDMFKSVAAQAGLSPAELLQLLND